MFIQPPAPPPPAEGPPRPLSQVLGETAREARLRARLTQAEVASRSEIATSVYQRLERGRLLPSLPTLYRICTALGLSPNELMGFPYNLPASEASISSARKELLHRMRQLNERQAFALLRFLQGFR
ncbi:helix-turn-helix domain-containing protein [Corallococcus sp. M34]|uniref:helix-turn-helix domain-containing protein n=1 Tax=Citreicoccus inhibens TaxID=2849499 RepID=UPI001C21C659|nr:helix-turn-helix transcriptional regulator [Citreicoccus inhibens]MBU8900921.1 helix-turn-helix domain-containing protein [Citreicoccus inhibens]